MNPPKPKKVRKILSAHGDKRVDYYYWLRDDSRKNKEILDYLKSENNYTSSWFRKREIDVKSVYKEYLDFLPRFEQTFKNKIGEASYFSTIASKDQHRKYYKLQSNKKTLLLDVNKESKNHAFYDISMISPSPNHNLIAFGEDKNGRREFEIKVKNIKTRKIIDSAVKNSSGSIVWNNSSCGYFYLKKDQKTLITNKLFFHKLGTPQKKDILIYQEKDPEFNLSISKSRTKKLLILVSSKTEANETWVLDLADQKLKIKCFQKRRKNHLYYMDDSETDFFVMSNFGNKINFAIYKCSKTFTALKNWKLFLPYEADELILDFLNFKNHLVLETRKKGLSHIAIIDLKTMKKRYLAFKDKSYAVSLSQNSNYNEKKLFFTYTSLRVPPAIFSQSLSSNTRKKEWQQTVKNYKENQYQVNRIFFKSRDGKKIPVSYVHKKNIDLTKAPLLIYGYGSYGSIIEASFRMSFMPLINKGFVFAIAHIRGGQDLGRDWYYDGKMLNKQNTFNDFIDCTKQMVKRKMCNKDNLFAMGGSAGGLLMGAIINQEPTLYKGIVSAVPFVDVLTTMSDESIPLTTFEYKEWGNPSVKKEYNYIKKYSPYDNIDYKPYPAVLVTSSLYDSQVQYFEPAKYVPKLREFSTSNNPILLNMNLIGGHAGKSGRLEAFKETAFELSFILDLSKKRPN